MKYIILAAAQNTQSAIRYCGIVSLGIWTATESMRKCYFAFGGTLKDLRVKLSGSPGAGKSYTFTIRKNGADTSLQCTISDSETSDADTTHEVSISQDDYITLKCVPSGSPTIRTPYFTLIFDGDTQKYSPLMSGFALLGAPTDLYAPIRAGGLKYITSENVANQLTPIGGTVKDLRVKLSQAPGTGSQGYRIMFRKNHADTSLYCDVQGESTEGSTSDTVDVVAGDILTFKCSPLNSPVNNPYIDVSSIFVADTNDRFPGICGSADDLVGTSGTEYVFLSDATSGVITGDTNYRTQLAQRCTLKGLYIKLGIAPGIGKSRTFTVQRNGGDTSLAVTISSTNTTGSASTDVEFYNDDEVRLECTSSGSPTASRVDYGVYFYGFEIPEIYGYAYWM